jgi:hypothetical protein
MVSRTARAPVQALAILGPERKTRDQFRRHRRERHDLVDVEQRQLRVVPPRERHRVVQRAAGMVGKIDRAQNSLYLAMAEPSGVVDRVCTTTAKRAGTGGLVNVRSGAFARAARAPEPRSAGGTREITHTARQNRAASPWRQSSIERPPDTPRQPAAPSAREGYRVRVKMMAAPPGTTAGATSNPPLPCPMPTVRPATMPTAAPKITSLA